MNTKQWTGGLLALVCALVLCGCGGGERETCWILRREPTTDEECKAVAAHAERILAATPHTLSGHDQDWDDAIHMAHSEAKQALCRPTLWEFQREDWAGMWRETGRWKYVEEAKE